MLQIVYYSVKGLNSQVSLLRALLKKGYIEKGRRGIYQTTENGEKYMEIIKG